MSSIYLRFRKTSEKEQEKIEDIQDMKTVQQKIQNYITTLADLNDKFHQKQEESFLITFVEIMDKMAEQLFKAKKKYDDIDLEVKKQQVCFKLEKELFFFKRDNAQLRKLINLMKTQNKMLKEKNQQHKETIIAFKNTLKGTSRSSQKRCFLNGSTMSKNTINPQQLSIPQIHNKTTAKRIYFRTHRRAESNLSIRQDTSVRQNRPPQYSSLQLSFQMQILSLWRGFKSQYPQNFSLIRPKAKDKIIDLFLSSPRIISILKRLILSTESSD